MAAGVPLVFVVEVLDAMPAGRGLAGPSVPGGISKIMESPDRYFTLQGQKQKRLYIRVWVSLLYLECSVSSLRVGPNYKAHRQHLTILWRVHKHQSYD